MKKRNDLIEVELPNIALMPGLDAIFCKEVNITPPTNNAGISVPSTFKGKSKREDDIIEYRRYFVIKYGEEAKKRFPLLEVGSEIGISIDASAGHSTFAEMIDFKTGNKFSVIHFMQVNGYTTSILSADDIKSFEAKNLQIEGRGNGSI